MSISERIQCREICIPGQPKGKNLKYDPSCHGTSATVDPEQLIFKSSSVALLRAEKEERHMPDVHVVERDGGPNCSPHMHIHVHEKMGNDCPPKCCEPITFSSSGGGGGCRPPSGGGGCRPSSGGGGGCKPPCSPCRPSPPCPCPCPPPCPPTFGRSPASVTPPFLPDAKRVLEFLHCMWKKNRLCDVTLIAEDRSIFAHKIALAAYSESVSQEIEKFPAGQTLVINVEEFPTEIVQAIVQFTYTTELCLNDDNIQDIMACATVLGFEIIKDIVRNHLENYNENNALLYCTIAEDYDMCDVAEKISNFIVAHFEEIVNSRHFLYANAETLMSWLSHESLLIRNELNLFQAIIKWIDFDREERICYSPAILKCVCLHRILPEDLVISVERNDIFEIKECFEQLYQAMRYHALRFSGSKLAKSLEKTPPRSGCCPKDVSCRIKEDNKKCKQKNVNVNRCQTKCDPCGMDMPTRPCHRESELSSGCVKPKPCSPRCETDSSCQSRFSSRCPPKQKDFTMSRCKTNVVEFEAPCDLLKKSKKTQKCFSNTSRSNPQDVNDSIVITAGGIDLKNFDKETPGKYIYKFESCVNSWVPVAVMPKFIHHHGIGVVDGMLYVIGGAAYEDNKSGNLGTATKEVYRFDPISKEWSQMSSMNVRRAYLGIAVHFRKIYTVGGEDETKRRLDTIECYDTMTDKWTIITKIPSGPKIGAAVAIFKGQLFVIGGYNKDAAHQVLSDVECYDLSKQRWTTKNPLVLPRCHANLVVVRNRLYLIGGRSRLPGTTPTVTSLTLVEEYDEYSDVWESVADMKTPRHDAGCAAIGTRLYIVGGMTSPKPYCLSSVECFDVQKRQWLPCVQNLPHTVAGVACCALDEI